MEHFLVQWGRGSADWFGIAVLGFGFELGEGVSSEWMWTCLWFWFDWGDFGDWAPADLFLLLLLVRVPGLLLFGLEVREEWNWGSCGRDQVGVWDRG